MKKFENWFYEFVHGHPFLVKEEADIICDTRFDDRYKWMNDEQIKELVRIRIGKMYKEKFPGARRFFIF